MKTVAVIFGGRSVEHDVSIVTALASIIKPLELAKSYQVEAVYIAKDGSWYWDDKLKDIALYSSGAINDFLAKASKTHILFDDGLTLVKSGQLAGRKLYRHIDLVFPAMHGTHGEDGELMALLEMAGVPYVGCEVAASVLAMDKILAKKVTAADGIPSTPWVACTASELARDPMAVIASTRQLAYPLFVKPARQGSSIGITRVTEEAQLMNALEVAAHYDDRIIIEQAVSSLIEVTLPVIGNDDLVPAYLEQPLTKPDDFFDFDAKYLSGGKGGKQAGGGKGSKGAQGYSKIPAELPGDLYQKAEARALDVYKSLGCTGIARVDLLVDTKAGEAYFNEVNPLPGGLYAHNWRKKGMSNVELVERLVRLADERHAAKQRLQTSFATNYLQQF